MEAGIKEPTTGSGASNPGMALVKIRDLEG